MIWYIEKSGEAKEIPEEVLKYKIENNEISGDTLAVNEEIKNWVPLKETALWKEYNSEGSGNSAADFDLNSASHQWRCPKCGNMINKEPCPYCAQGEPTQTTHDFLFDKIFLDICKLQSLHIYAKLYQLIFLDICKKLLVYADIFLREAADIVKIVFKPYFHQLALFNYLLCAFCLFSIYKNFPRIR